MGSHENLTHKWLRQNIQAYAHRDTLFQHVDTALARYPTIRPKTDVYSSVPVFHRPRAAAHAHAPLVFQPSMTAAHSSCSVCMVFCR